MLKSLRSPVRWGFKIFSLTQLLDGLPKDFMPHLPIHKYTTYLHKSAFQMLAKSVVLLRAEHRNWTAIEVQYLHCTNTCTSSTCMKKLMDSSPLQVLCWLYIRVKHVKNSVGNNPYHLIFFPCRCQHRIGFKLHFWGFS